MAFWNNFINNSIKTFIDFLSDLCWGSQTIHVKGIPYFSTAESCLATENDHQSLFLRYLYLWKWASRNVCNPPNFIIYSLFWRWRTALSDFYHSRTVRGKNFMENKMKLLPIFWRIFYCAVRVIEFLVFLAAWQLILHHA